MREKCGKLGESEESKEANRFGWISVQFMARATLVVKLGGKIVVRLATASLENVKIFMIENKCGLLRLSMGQVWFEVELQFCRRIKGDV